MRQSETAPQLPAARITAANSVLDQGTENWEPVRQIIAAWSATEPETVVRAWVPVERIINKAQASQGADQWELARLLRKSNRLLWPLDDPFSSDFGLHRWLRSSREEVYSDWLAWIAIRLDSAADVFDLFGLDPPPGARRWKDTAIKRESPIRDGRLDIVVQWPGRALLVVEVKVTDERFASTSKQKGYREWLNKQDVPEKKAVLLVTDTDAGASTGDFTKLGWRQVCLKLRCIAAARLGKERKAGLGTNREVVRAALTLAFAGAVEQNLLDMPGRPLRLMDEGHLLNVIPTKEHLEEFHRSVQR
jgi:hypothetical protein